MILTSVVPIRTTRSYPYCSPMLFLSTLFTYNIPICTHLCYLYPLCSFYQCYNLLCRSYICSYPCFSPMFFLSALLISVILIHDSHVCCSNTHRSLLFLLSVKFTSVITICVTHICYSNLATHLCSPCRDPFVHWK